MYEEAKTSYFTYAQNMEDLKKNWKKQSMILEGISNQKLEMLFYKI